MVESKTFGLLQHDPFTWLLDKGEFIYVKNLSSLQKKRDEALNDWVCALPVKDRKIFVDTLYQVISASHAENLIDFTADWKKSMNGVVGLETSFPTLYTALVKPGILPLHRLIELMSVSPNQRFGFQMPSLQDSFTLFDLSDKYIVDPDQFLSMGRSTPFQGMEVYGRCLATVYKNKAVWLDKSTHYFKEEA